MISTTNIPAYIRPEMSLNIMGEKDVLSSQSGWTFSYMDTNTKIEHLSLKLTSHRLVLYHPTNKENFNFEYHFENIKNYQIDVKIFKYFSNFVNRKGEFFQKLLTN